MATFRFLQTGFWRDDYFSEISPEDKYFYIYLLTNEMCTQCGIYTLVPKFAALELGYSVDTVKALINRFVDYGKIFYNEEKCEVMIINWYKYNINVNNRNSRICINSCLKKVKTEAFINILYNSCLNFFEDSREEVEAMFKGIKIDVKKGSIIYPDFNGIQGKEADEENEEKKTIFEDLKEEAGNEKITEEAGSYIAADLEDSNREKKVSLGEVINIFNNNFHLITPMEREKLLDWCEVLSPEVVVKALEIAVENNVRTMKYINAILMNWKENGVEDLSTLEAKLQQDKERLGKAAVVKQKNFTKEGSTGREKWQCEAHNKIFEDDSYEDEDIF